MGGAGSPEDDGAAAFRAVYDEHVRFVWRTLVHLGVPPSDLADAAQDVFVVVLRKLGEFERRAKMTTWLFAICARVASRRRRRAHLRRELPSSEVDLLEGTAALDAAALLDRRRALAILDAILARLPDEMRVVFILFEIEGMSGEEIAELLGAPVGTIRSRLRLARADYEKAIVRWRAGARAQVGGLLRRREA